MSNHPIIPDNVTKEEEKRINKEFANDVAYKKKNKVNQVTPKADA